MARVPLIPQAGARPEAIVIGRLAKSQNNLARKAGANASAAGRVTGFFS